jgi:hypothetical protein
VIVGTSADSFPCAPGAPSGHSGIGPTGSAARANDPIAIAISAHRIATALD